MMLRPSRRPVSIRSDLITLWVQPVPSLGPASQPDLAVACKMLHASLGPALVRDGPPVWCEGDVAQIQHMQRQHGRRTLTGI